MNGLNEYDGHWITTFTGKKFHYLDPRPSEIDIRDIAHALSLTCRFGGHCKVFYSVADHSIRVMDLVEKPYKLTALLHDAHEAYLHDVPRPIKLDMKGYKEIADRIQLAIDSRFKIKRNFDISFVDNILLATEARDLLVSTKDWADLPTPLEEIIFPWTSRDAEESFITAFQIYGHERKV